MKRKQPSLSEFSGLNDKVRYNIITDNQSILTVGIKQPKAGYNIHTLDTLTMRSMKFCSRFESCSAPKCPLDPCVNSRTEADGDPKCTMPKATRHKYWLSMPEDLKDALPFQGYLEAEFKRIKAARERWESLPEDDKAAVKDRLRKFKKGSS